MKKYLLFLLVPIMGLIISGVGVAKKLNGKILFSEDVIVTGLDSKTQQNYKIKVHPFIILPRPYPSDYSKTGGKEYAITRSENLVYQIENLTMEQVVAPETQIGLKVCYRKRSKEKVDVPGKRHKKRDQMSLNYLQCSGLHEEGFGGRCHTYRLSLAKDLPTGSVNNDTTQISKDFTVDFGTNNITCTAPMIIPPIKK